MLSEIHGYNHWILRWQFYCLHQLACTTINHSRKHYSHGDDKIVTEESLLHYPFLLWEQMTNIPASIHIPRVDEQYSETVERGLTSRSGSASNVK